MNKENKKLSPCCEAEEVLSARYLGKEARRCAKCKKLNIYKIITFKK